MASTEMTLMSRRAAGQETWSGLVSDIDNAQSQMFNLPPAVGDVLLLEVAVQVSSIATMMTTPHLVGPQISIVDPAESSNRDILAMPNWVQVQTTELTAIGKPDQARFWGVAERIAVRFAEVDTNGAPTADLRVWALVRPLRAGA